MFLSSSDKRDHWKTIVTEIINISTIIRGNILIGNLF